MSYKAPTYFTYLGDFTEKERELLNDFPENWIIRYIDINMTKYKIGEIRLCYKTSVQYYKINIYFGISVTGQDSTSIAITTGRRILPSPNVSPNNWASDYWTVAQAIEYIESQNLPPLSNFILSSTTWFRTTRNPAPSYPFPTEITSYEEAAGFAINNIYGGDRAEPHFKNAASVDY